MDNVDELIEKIRNDSSVRNTNFSNKLLNIVSEMCSRHGYGATRLFLMGRNDDEARVLIKILDMIEERSISLEIGTLLLKKLNVIKIERRQENEKVDKI